MPHEDSILSRAFDNLIRGDMVKDCITTALNNYNTGLSEDQFYSMNIVDATDITDDDMRNARAEFVKYCEDNGCYAALPPFEEGSFIDRSERRFFHWKVLEVQEDYYRMSLEYYPLLVIRDNITDPYNTMDYSKLSHPCWYLAGRVTIKVKWLTDSEYRDLLSHLPEYAEKVDSICKNPRKKDELLTTLATNIRFDKCIGGVIEDYEYYYPHDLMKLRKKGKYFTASGEFINGAWVKDAIDSTMKHVVDRGLHSMLFVSCGPLLESFIYINCVLSNKSGSTSTHRTVSSVYAPNSEIPDVRKERHFGKFTVVSEKKPRAITTENIQRVYTAISWQRRGHLRHYASGKVVPVKSAVCRRHNTEEISAPQVIYKV